MFSRIFRMRWLNTGWIWWRYRSCPRTQLQAMEILKDELTLVFHQNIRWRRRKK